ncbi:MAG: proprotein convertase P-domain-containing protein [Bacteroidetes bacterium]|nr:proprotein convertase P-domain-containing protein [Bacteroidota bacterium]
MKKITLLLVIMLACVGISHSQCTTTNATTCVCATAGVTNCDLLPDIMVARPPLLINGSSGVVEYSQTGNGSNDGLLRITVSTPNIGLGPLEVRGTNVFVCGTDTIVGTAPTTCPTTGLPPKQLLNQRVYHKNGSVMTSTDYPAGTMTYHPSHGHQHVDDWGVYTLRTATTDPNPLNWPIVGTGAKLSFCLLDLSNCTSSNGHCVNDQGTVLNSSNMPNYGLGGGTYGCSQTLQGISAGYVDIYSQSLDGMFITIPPNICNGLYYIVVQLDPNNNFLESNETNNVISVPFTLTKQSGTVPTISVSGSTSLCPGNTVVLTSSPAPSYLWSNGATTQSITVSQAGNYSVTTNVNSLCPASSLPMAVTVQNMPVTITPTSTALCPGQNSTLNTTVTTPPNGTVQTSFTNSIVYNIPDNNATGVASPLIVSGINPATLASGSIFSVMANITHTYTGDLVVALISPSGNTVNLSNRRGGGGDNFNNTIFSMSASTAIASGSPPFNGSYIPDGSLNSFTGATNGTWQLKVTDLAGVDIGTINSWTLTFNNVVTTQLVYSWTSIPPGFTSALQNPNVTPAANTTYNLIVTNIINGCSGTGSVAVSVNPVVLSVSSNTAICAGASTTLAASGAASYLWSPATGLSATNVASVTASPAATTTYTVTGTNTTGCTASQNVTVTVNALPVVVVSNDTAFCAGGTSTLAASGADSYLWSPATGLSATNVASVNASPAATTTYTVTGTNTNGCSASQNVTITINALPMVLVGANAPICAGASTSLTASGAASYIWSPATGLSATNVASVTASPAATTTYTVTGANAAGCTASQNVTVTVNPLPVVTLANFSSVCQTAAAFALSGGSPAGGSYSGPGVNAGSFSPATAGIGTHTISYLYQDANGCSASTSKTITVDNCNCITPGTPGSIAGAASVCASSAVTYSVNFNANVSSYNWVAPPNATITAGQGTNTVTVTYGSNYTTGSLCVAAANACGSSLPRCKTITKTTSRTPGNILGQLTGQCQANVNLSVAAVAGATSYNWSVPAGTTLISGQGTNAITLTTNVGFVSGQVCVTAFNGCINSTSRCAVLYGAPAKGVIQGVSTVCAGQTNLNYSVPAAFGATTYTWTVPSGSTIVSGQGTNAIVVTFGATAGNVAVTAKNTCGNRGTSTFPVTINCRVSGVENNFDILLTPNPASSNTEVHISGNIIEKAVVTVTNVLGKDVYMENVVLDQKQLFSLNLTGLSKGIYLVTVTSGSNKKSVRLVVD